MAPGAARLKRRAEFLRVAGARRKWVAPGLILQVRRQQPDDRPVGKVPPLRVGFTVSRKVGGAVVRNRARRRLRAAAEAILPRFAATGHDYVLIGRGGTVARAFPALLDDLKTALGKLGVLVEQGKA